ncbi:hypothetical protein LPJ63_003976 [Coemansia sp. RSA 2711]|nr:hypothetical protein LPJ63_003976 [Coemansia sp. RSA 2711]
MSTTIDELDFPKAVLMRMIKAGLPENIAIQKEARNSVTKAATVFVSYLAAAANDYGEERGEDGDEHAEDEENEEAASETATAIEPVAVSLTDPAPETDSMDIDDPEAKRARIE